MSSKENKNVIKSEAFRQQSEEHHSRRKMGVGETYPTYHYADFEKWLSATVPETSNEIIHEQNETVQNVMRACDWLANKYLFPYERKNGPSFADRNYAALKIQWYLQQHI